MLGEVGEGLYLRWERSGLGAPPEFSRDGARRRTASVIEGEASMAHAATVGERGRA